MRNILLLSLVVACLIPDQAYPQARNIRQNAQAVAASTNRVAQTVNNSQMLPISRVILYSNGVAYIERRGVILNNAEINLSFKQSQVDDVLKSMTVLDLGRGKIGAVSYNSSAPPSARMAEIPFNVSSVSEESDESPAGLAGVLTQLQGAKVIVTSKNGTATGSILTVEKRQTPSQKKDQQESDLPISYALVIASGLGEISSFDLKDIRSVKLLDEETRQDLNAFANASASARRRDAKTITITSEGSGSREMVVSYTIAAPIWKTTYRVVLDEQGKPFFQGWAIVDNVSDEDWKDVSLGLVSGSPVSFIQNLQKPLYRYRPVIPIPEDLNLDPQIYDPEIAISPSTQGNRIGYGSGNGNGDAAPPLKMSAETVTVSAAVQTNISDALTSGQSGVKAAATGAELGDLFEYKIDNPVTLAHDRSALIPIVQTKMDGEKISIYNEVANKDRPLSGLLLTNKTALTFEGGSLTVLDRDAYAGEALMERLKPQEKRLISFALDLGTLVSAEQKEDREPAKLIKIVKGVFQVHYFLTNEKIYHLVNQTDESKVLYIEHPIREDWLLSDTTPKPEGATKEFYRFRVELQPFEKRDLEVTERQGLMDSYQLTGLTPGQLEMFLTMHYVDEAARQKLFHLIELRLQINKITEQLNALNEEEKFISEDQKRLRENIESLAKTAEAKQLIERYIAKANDQESRIETIGKERQTLKADREQLENELAEAIRNFELERHPG